MDLPDSVLLVAAMFTFKQIPFSFAYLNFAYFEPPSKFPYCFIENPDSQPDEGDTMLYCYVTKEQCKGGIPTASENASAFLIQAEGIQMAECDAQSGFFARIIDRVILSGDDYCGDRNRSFALLRASSYGTYAYCNGGHISLLPRSCKLDDLSSQFYSIGGTNSTNLFTSTINGTIVAVGTTVTVNCPYGSPIHSMRTCLDSLAWDSSNPTCGTLCVPPLLHNSKNTSSFAPNSEALWPYYSVITVTCMQGYSMEDGSNMSVITCINGTWLNGTTECLACIDSAWAVPIIVEYSQLPTAIIGNQIMLAIGTTVSYICAPGTTTADGTNSFSRTCLQTGNWSDAFAGINCNSDTTSTTLDSTSSIPMSTTTVILSTNTPTMKGIHTSKSASSEKTKSSSAQSDFSSGTPTMLPSSTKPVRKSGKISESNTERPFSTTADKIITAAIIVLIIANVIHYQQAIVHLM